MAHGIWHHSTTDLHNAIFSVLRHKTQITMQSECQSDSDGMTVDRCYDWLTNLPCGRVHRIGTEICYFGFVKDIGAM